MKNSIIKLLGACLLFCSNAYAQMPPVIPIWDANKVTLGLHKITNDIYAIIPTTAETETTKGIPRQQQEGLLWAKKEYC